MKEVPRLATPCLLESHGNEGDLISYPLWHLLVGEDSGWIFSHGHGTRTHTTKYLLVKRYCLMHVTSVRQLKLPSQGTQLINKT